VKDRALNKQKQKKKGILVYTPEWKAICGKKGTDKGQKKETQGIKKRGQKKAPEKNGKGKVETVKLKKQGPNDTGGKRGR